MTSAAAVDLCDRPVSRGPSPFDLDDDATYRRWRDWKLEQRARSADDLVVELRDPRALRPAEHAALQGRIARTNMALYRSPLVDEDPRIPRALGAQLGLVRLDANWLADEDGISRIAVTSNTDAGGSGGGRADFIPYTDHAIRWHTDGYYHPEARRIHGMILHCVRPAARGGESGLLDHELAYIALRDADPDAVRALMAPDALTIPERSDDAGVARPAQGGPVFSLAPDGGLHMRYTARTRSIRWKDDAATQAAVARLAQLMADGERPWVLRLRLEPGMGLVGHNVLHERSAFADDPAAPRLLYRARFLDRVAGMAPWRPAP
jgi:alpha-ketoglutarate-dependent taurine dioxygenase